MIEAKRVMTPIQANMSPCPSLTGKIHTCDSDLGQLGEQGESGRHDERDKGEYHGTCTMVRQGVKSGGHPDVTTTSDKDVAGGQFKLITSISTTHPRI